MFYLSLIDTVMTAQKLTIDCSFRRSKAQVEMPAPPKNAVFGVCKNKMRMFAGAYRILASTSLPHEWTQFDCNKSNCSNEQG